MAEDDSETIRSVIHDIIRDNYKFCSLKVDSTLEEDWEWHICCICHVTMATTNLVCLWVMFLKAIFYQFRQHFWKLHVFNKSWKCSKWQRFIYIRILSHIKCTIRRKSLDFHTHVSTHHRIVSQWTIWISLGCK